MKEDGGPAGRAVETARSAFLRDDNFYGCAESTLVALQHVYGLPDPDDSSAAVVLNGGVAYSGGICGAVSGAALAVGKLAGVRIGDHRQAKRVARQLIQQLMVEFREEFSSTDCRELIDYEISDRAEHDAFIAGNVWRTTCMQQIEFSVSRLGLLADEQVWIEELAALEA